MILDLEWLPLHNRKLAQQSEADKTEALSRAVAMSNEPVALPAAMRDQDTQGGLKWQTNPRFHPNQKSSSRLQRGQVARVLALQDALARKEGDMLFFIAAFVFTLAIALLVGVEA